MKEFLRAAVNAAVAIVISVLLVMVLANVLKSAGVLPSRLECHRQYDGDVCHWR